MREGGRAGGRAGGREGGSEGKREGEVIWTCRQVRTYGRGVTLSRGLVCLHVTVGLKGRCYQMHARDAFHLSTQLFHSASR